MYRSHPDYSIAEEMIHHDCVREANCIPFDYNKACTYYNGSLVETESRRFIAMMGPRDKDLLSFFRLLIDASVGGLVRLTPACEGAVSKCYPYWEGIVHEASLQIPFGKGAYSVPYFAIDNWKDNHGNEPVELFEFVQRVRKADDPMNGPLAVHCTNGVGMTGTVIAAITLLDEATSPFFIRASLTPHPADGFTLLEPIYSIPSRPLLSAPFLPVRSDTKTTIRMKIAEKWSSPQGS